MLENRICTFIDILGFKDLVKRTDSDPEFANQIFDSLRLINNSNELLNDPKLKSIVRFVLEQNAETKIDSIIPRKSSDKIKGISFSDSLIISSEPNLEGWLNHILVIILLVHRLLELGFLIRGGMAVGNLLQEQKVVFGSGLVRAYDLESKVSNYPRITVSDEAFKNLINIEPAPGALTKFFVSDFDGILILDYLEEPALRIASYKDKETNWEGMLETNRKYATRIEIARNSIDAIIQNNKTNDYKILSKLRWIAMNMNRSLSSKEYFLVQDIIIPTLPNNV